MPWWSILLLILLAIYIIGMIVYLYKKKKNGTLGACGDCPSGSSCHGQCNHGNQSELLKYYKDSKKSDNKEDNKTPKQ